MTTNDTFLTCHTDSTTCCRGVHDAPTSGMGAGEWLFPNGTSIAQNSVTGSGFYWSRYHQVVRLYRQGDTQTPLGCYCCRIPDDAGVNRTFCANLFGEFIIVTYLVTKIDNHFSVSLCNPLIAPDNGMVIYSNQSYNEMYIFGTVATCTCSPGYGLSSTQSRTCTTVNGGGTIGRFSGSEPSCDRE